MKLISELTYDDVLNAINSVNIKSTDCRLEAVATAVHSILTDNRLAVNIFLDSEVYEIVRERLGISYTAAIGRIRSFKNDFMAAHGSRLGVSTIPIYVMFRSLAAIVLYYYWGQWGHSTKPTT